MLQGEGGGCRCIGVCVWAVQGTQVAAWGSTRPPGIPVWVVVLGLGVATGMITRRRLFSCPAMAGGERVLGMLIQLVRKKALMRPPQTFTPSGCPCPTERRRGAGSGEPPLPPGTGAARAGADAPEDRKGGMRVVGGGMAGGGWDGAVPKGGSPPQPHWEAPGRNSTAVRFSPLGCGC